MSIYRMRADGAIVTEQQLRESFSGCLPHPLRLEDVVIAGADPVLWTPQPESTPTTYYVQDGVEQNADGFWVMQWAAVSRTEEEIDTAAAQQAAMQRMTAKEARELAVAAIKVTTAAGNTFDGDEISQGRMARAIIALSGTPAVSSVVWVLADNSVINATVAELTEALALAGQAQADLWVIE